MMDNHHEIGGGSPKSRLCSLQRILIGVVAMMLFFLLMDFDLTGDKSPSRVKKNRGGLKIHHSKEDELVYRACSNQISAYCGVDGSECGETTKSGVYDYERLHKLLWAGNHIEAAVFGNSVAR